MQAMRERAAAFGVAALHWEELANGEHAAISHGAALLLSCMLHLCVVSESIGAGWCMPVAALLGVVLARAW